MMRENNKMRIARYLASCGISSRRKSEDYILNGRVKVNDVVVRDLSFKVTKKDKVEIDGSLLKYQDKITLMLNKPAGYLSTVKDDFKRKTVIDLLGDIDRRLYPVGRLDNDSRGLMILTNDGDLAYRVTHPKFKIPKTYEVVLGEKLGINDIDVIKKGIKIEERELIPISVKILSSREKKTVIELKIVEGRKRIIRKTFKKIGYNVIDLKRIKIGHLRLNGLEEGHYRLLNNRDLEELYKN